MEYPKRLIEVDLPIKRISTQARREKSIRHGHISTMHIWWARRPLAACRAVVCASLWPDPGDAACPDGFTDIASKAMHFWARDCLGRCSEESYPRFLRIKQKGLPSDPGEMLRLALLDFIADFAAWQNANDRAFLAVARVLTAAAHAGLSGQAALSLPESITIEALETAVAEAETRPVVLDPFAGGGAFPLEGLRCGADAFGTDLNPVAVLLNRAVLEFIPRFGADLAEELEKWGTWIKSEALRELGELYPEDSDSAHPIAYLWARIAHCEGPGCGAEIPLLRSPLLGKKGNRRTVLDIGLKGKVVDASVRELRRGESVGEGTLRRGSATCLACGYSMNGETVRAQFKGTRGGADTSRLMAVVCEGKNGKRFYRDPCDGDIEAFEGAKRRRAELEGQVGPLGLPEIPDEELPYLRSIFNIQLLDVKRWGDLFNARQVVTIAWLCKKLHEVKGKIQQDDLGNAVLTLLAFAVDRQADYSTSICTWVQTGEFIGHNFAQGQSLPIKWDYAETCPFSSGSGNWDGAIGWIARVVRNLAEARLAEGHAEIMSATEHTLPDDMVDGFFTDPPYYDAVPYADLSDFFYVWLRRSIGDVHADVLSSPLTEKKREAVQLAERNQSYAYKTRENFEQLVRQAFTEGRRMTKPSGIGVIVFAHKDTAAWETLLSSVIESGWMATASWPIDTEMQARLRAHGSAALASSVHIVCRPREGEDGSLRQDTGDWRDVLGELPGRIRAWLPRLAAEGVVGADAIFACLGPALEIFSRYSSVEKTSGEKVELREFLEQVWAEVAKQALNMIFEGADTAGLEEDARLTAMWLWTLRTDAESDVEAGEKVERIAGYSLEYDAARKIAQGLGCHLENLAHLVEVQGENATLLSAASRAHYLFGKEDVNVPKKRGKKAAAQGDLFAVLNLPSDEDMDREQVELERPAAGKTALDQLHQSMILFGAGRGQALKRFLVDDGVGANAQMWSLAQSLSALYPPQSEEKRWVDGVLARKKGLGF